MQTTAHAILIIESDLPTLELYQRELSRDYKVYSCTTAQQAGTLLRTRRISAVVLEPAIAGEEGWSFLAAMKRRPGRACIPIVLCSTLDERKRGMEMGAAAYLVKPVLPSTLLAALHEVTRSK